MSKFMSVSFDSQLPLDIKAIALPEAIALNAQLDLTFPVLLDIFGNIPGQRAALLEFGFLALKLPRFIGALIGSVNAIA